MPRAVDPPGKYPTPDMDPAQRADQRIDITTFPGFDWIGWLIGELRKIIHSIISFLIQMIAFFTGGLIDLTPIHEIIDEIIDSIIADLGTGENLLKLWRVIVSIIETATGVNLTRVFMELLPALLGLLNDLSEITGATGQAIAELIMLPLNILRQLQAIFSGQPADLTGIAEAFQPIINAFSAWWSIVGTHLPSAIDQAAQALWYIAELLYTLGLNSIAGLGGLINDLATGLRNAIAGAGISLDQTLANAGTALGQAIAGASEGIIAVLEGAGITITGTLQEAGQQLGAAVIAANDALWSMVGAAGVNLDQTLNNAGAALGQFVTNAQANAQGVIDALNNAAQGAQQAAGAALSTAYENFNALINAIPTFLQGLTAGGRYGQAGMNAALEAQAAANAAKAAEIAAIQSAFAAVFNVNPVGGGSVSATIDFSAMGNQPGMAGIMVPDIASGPGYMGITNGAATWQGGPGTDIQLFPTPTESVYQVLDVNIGALNDLLANIGGLRIVHLDLIFRCNAARNTFGAVRLYSTAGIPYASLVACVNGTLTELAASAPLSTLAGGGRFRIVAGNPGAQAPWAMQVLYNSIPVITYDDVSHVSQVGPGFCYLGLSMTVANTAAMSQIWGPAGGGAYAYAVPYWATNIDGILLGGGGGGRALGLVGAWGEGGMNGSWSVFRIKRGDEPDVYATHRIPWGTTQITGTVGHGGAGGTAGGNGQWGGGTDSNATIDGAATQFGYASGGYGGYQANLDVSGKSPNPPVFSYWGYNYDSGGGGTGGNAAIITLTQGAPGTAGRAWYRAYNPIPLNPPTVSIVSYQDNPPPPSLYPIADIPEPGVKGRVYLPSDVGLLLRDNGEEWERFLGGPLGVFTAPDEVEWLTGALPAGASWQRDRDGYKLTSPPGPGWAYMYRPYPAGAFVLTVYVEAAYPTGLGIPAATNTALRTGIVTSNDTALLHFGPSSVNTAAGAVWLVGHGWYVAGSYWPNLATTTGVTEYATSIGYYVATPFVGQGGLPCWYRFTDNGINRIMEFSANGVDWREYRTASRTEYFTPTRIGIGAQVMAGAGNGSGIIRLRSWHGVP